MITDNGTIPPDVGDVDDAVDPDFLAITRYIEGDLSVDEALALEARAGQDAVFWNKVGPIVALQTLAITTATRALMDEEDRAEDDPARHLVPYVTRDKWKNRIYMGLAAMLMFCFGVGGLLVAAAHSPPLMHALAKGIGALVPSIGRNPAAREDQRDKLIGRAMVDGLGALVQDSTAPGETRTYRLDYGATAVVRPSSRVAYRVDGNAIDKATDLLTSRVTIDGTVVLTTSTTFTIRTRFAVIRAEHGQYAIQCVPFSHEMRLSVGTGNAEVFPNGATPAQGIHVTRGEYLVVPETGAPAISHDSTGFPGFGDTATVTVRKKP